MKNRRTPSALAAHRRRMIERKALRSFPGSHWSAQGQLAAGRLIRPNLSKNHIQIKMHESEMRLTRSLWLVDPR